ncbi:hypothetical protein [Peribacillus deserti]|nr:hypothetical protein [Peribacillus deserti]
MKEDKFSFDDNLLEHNEYEGLKGKDKDNPKGLGAPIPREQRDQS